MSQLEQIARRNLVTAMPHLLGDDFGGSLDAHIPAEQLHFFKRVFGEIRAGDKIDFAIGQDELYVAGGFNVVLCDVFRDIALTWRDVAQVLRVRYKNVHVAAHAVAVAEH